MGGIELLLSSTLNVVLNIEIYGYGFLNMKEDNVIMSEGNVLFNGFSKCVLDGMSMFTLKGSVEFGESSTLSLKGYSSISSETPFGIYGNAVTEAQDDSIIMTTSTISFYGTSKLLLHNATMLASSSTLSFYGNSIGIFDGSAGLTSETIAYVYGDANITFKGTSRIIPTNSLSCGDRGCFCIGIVYNYFEKQFNCWSYKLYVYQCKCSYFNGRKFICK
ncbi:hypothetical protein EIN_135360 [Entamoeba invadens IP1]|uniref:Uncharacterized protein n=1 Tax=Entamoeba invadens IP1 TaxID=370355 RepID=A0A0A1TXD3_ENTIV|nr:hypothetical protein EIN_135360 [Entamoeba invadens IP1]ELP85942.1 hypothetical protein EIN_135360 [Entamoeba invadens IP1]|eukprot:XP_004185288.1 hypothetical protein EIN_135360 [Entamoeba invadens IP1]